MSAKQRLKASLNTAATLGKAGKFDEAREILTSLTHDPDIDALGHRTSLGLPRQLHSALMRLAKVEKDALLSIGYQYNLVPPPSLLAEYSRFTTDERRDITAVNRLVVPHTIHQIWIGPDKPPLGIQAWKNHALEHGYEHHLWGENSLHDLGIDNNPVYSHMLSKGDYPGAVDVARYVILEQLGGVYLDCDWYPARNDISFHDLLPMTGLTAMAEHIPRNTGKGGLLMANSMIATPRHHPVFKRLLASLDDVMTDLPDEPAWWCTGPLIFTLMSRGGSLTLADAEFVAGSLPQSTSLPDVQAWCNQAQANDKGLLLAWKSWIW